MDRLLFGDNQFFGVNHMSEEKARAQAMKFQDIDAVQAVLDAAYDEGVTTFMCTTHERIAEIATVITSAVEEQHVATREIAYNVEEAAQGTDNVTEKIKKLEADASETGTAANWVLSFANQLAAEGSSLKAQVDSPVWHLVEALQTLVTDHGNRPAIDGWFEHVRPLTPRERALIAESARLRSEALGAVVTSAL